MSDEELNKMHYKYALELLRFIAVHRSDLQLTQKLAEKLGMDLETWIVPDYYCSGCEPDWYCDNCDLRREPMVNEGYL
jgi:hypothetical protein